MTTMGTEECTGQVDTDRYNNNNNKMGSRGWWSTRNEKLDVCWYFILLG